MRSPKWWMVPCFALVVIVSRTSVAEAAKEGRTGFGAGAEATTTGIVGGTFVYDAAVFHIDALLGGSFANSTSEVDVAGRFFFPLHRAQAADFSIGPGIGLVRRSRDPDGDGPQPSVSNTLVHLEGALQIRAFVVSNVALSASAGVGAIFSNGNNSAVIGGQVGASLGITYFFF